MLFKLKVPRDAQLLPAVRQIAERVAQCAGYTAEDATVVASSVGRAVEAILAQPAAVASDGLDIRFERAHGYLDVWVRFRGVPCDRPAAVGATSEQALREGMDSVEFGREGDVEFCRLRRALPREKTNHQCDGPADGH